jgi:LEA14-like dessication related protein
MKLALPISKTMVVLKLNIEVENPTTTTFVIRELNGGLFLNTNEKHLHMGDIKLLKVTKLPAKSKVTMNIVTSFKCKDLVNNWHLINMALNKRTIGNWELSGTIYGNIHKVPVSLPVKSTRPF